MADHALGQLRWHNGRLGLMLVNPHRQRFFLYAEKLLMMAANPGGVIEAKVRDRNPDKAIGYYPGQVVGTLTYQGEEAILTLVVGEPYRNLELPADGSLPDSYHVKMLFTFAERELNLLKDAISLMQKQRDDFADLLQGAEGVPLMPSIRAKKGPSPK